MIDGRANVIVANRRPSSTYLMYYENRQMLLQITTALSDLSSYSLSINTDTKTETIISLDRLLQPTKNEGKFVLKGFFNIALLSSLVFVILVILVICFARKDTLIITTRDYLAQPVSTDLYKKLTN